MRQLLAGVDTSVWSQFSVVIFSLAFILLCVWVFLPKRKKKYEEYSKFPLNKD